MNSILIFIIIALLALCAALLIMLNCDQRLQNKEFNKTWAERQKLMEEYFKENVN